FAREEQGYDYHLKIDLHGGMRVIAGKNKFGSSRRVACPKKLVDYFANSENRKFYQGHFCHDLWNKDTKKFKTMLFTFACQ
ncbi:MAG: hypothetical protein OXB84_06820, partial [Halobacteriovoraceae bacterium]|nr:hypothetical protein [Halobacteriovoraceae bacterium]